jgi:hypothetical protein
MLYCNRLVKGSRIYEKFGLVDVDQKGGGLLCYISTVRSKEVIKLYGQCACDPKKPHWH